MLPAETYHSDDRQSDKVYGKIEGMSLSDDSLVLIYSCRKGFRLIDRSRLKSRNYGIYNVFFERVRTAPNEALYLALHRLKKRGYVQNPERGVWRITAQGREYFRKEISRKRSLPEHIREKIKSKTKNLIVAFDLPEKHKRERAWLRAELTGLGFTMLQKSVWFGPR